MTITEAVKQIDGKPAGLINGKSVKYAQTLLLAGEDVLAASIANIQTKREKFPGVIAVTDQRILAVCGLPGIHRSLIIPLEDLDSCEESSSPLYYRAFFASRSVAFSMTIDPDIGEKFSPIIARLNGEEYGDIQVRTTTLLNPNLVRSKERNKLRKAREKKRALDKAIQRQKEAAARFQAAPADVPGAESTDTEGQKAESPSPDALKR